jgi:hypothetical protein
MVHLAVCTIRELMKKNMRMFSEMSQSSETRGQNMKKKIKE